MGRELSGQDCVVKESRTCWNWMGQRECENDMWEMLMPDRPVGAVRRAGWLWDASWGKYREGESKAKLKRHAMRARACLGLLVLYDGNLGSSMTASLRNRPAKSLDGSWSKNQNN